MARRLDLYDNIDLVWYIRLKHHYVIERKAISYDNNVNKHVMTCICFDDDTEVWNKSNMSTNDLVWIVINWVNNNHV
jgi:hypothetical protein